MARQSPAQKETVERVMHEFKHGELKIAGNGPKVKNPKQAIAIALREAGASSQESPAKSRKTLARTKGKERRGETAQDEAEGRGANRRKRTGGVAAGRADSKAALYAEAKRKNVPGRSRMSKDELARAVRG